MNNNSIILLYSCITNIVIGQYNLYKVWYLKMIIYIKKKNVSLK